MNDCRFFVPGPTWVRPEILAEMTRPMIGHRSAEFKDLFRKIIADLKPLFVTTQDTFVATCSGTGLMEASLANCATRRVLITTCGAFSDRWAAIAESLGLEVDRLETPWGTAVDPDALADHLASRRVHYDAVTLTHNETSTGVTNDVASLARVIREGSSDTLILVACRDSCPVRRMGPRRLLRECPKRNCTAAGHHGRCRFAASARARRKDTVSRHLFRFSAIQETRGH